ncbi:hypothetical protein PF008_g25446 [Phytophthora fragariae]|uniref:No apical meristem-associated C-terminal domain-containing protein n=1 Tax=Phytophthora fragariae TaxID=53985 RepID=A0A6G0QK38_9STRA|nr:hypothetical protein PF008_g25446 [Phytophthora fragariae]
MSKKVSKFIRCEESRVTARVGYDGAQRAPEGAGTLPCGEQQYLPVPGVLRRTVSMPKFRKLMQVLNKRKSLELCGENARDSSAEIEGTTALPSTSGEGKGAKEANGVKCSKLKRSQEQLQARTVKAQENLLSSMASKTEVAKMRLRIQEEHALQSMLNKLYAVEPTHASFSCVLLSTGAKSEAVNLQHRIVIRQQRPNLRLLLLYRWNCS